MKLTPTKRYRLSYCDVVLKLVRINKGTPVTYEWVDDNGKTTINRQVDVDKWIKFKKISEA